VVPPFRAGKSVVIAYTAGRYTPPGPKPGPLGFLGLYLSRADRGLTFYTFDTDGNIMAFSRVAADKSAVEYALIVGWLKYDVPFSQWHLYNLAAPEALALRQLRLVKSYEVARRAVAAVLYQARSREHFGLPKLKPMFAFSHRDPSADALEREYIMNSVARRRAVRPTE
jgi:hypothetical protein